MIGYHSQVTIARPRINDGMAKPNAKQTIMHMIAAGAYIKGSRVNVLGPPVKVRFGDPRRGEVTEITYEPRCYRVEVHVVDQHADVPGTVHEDGIKLECCGGLPRAGATLAADAEKGYQARSVDDLNRKIVETMAFIDVEAALASASGSRVQDLASLNRSLRMFRGRPCGC